MSLREELGAWHEACICYEQENYAKAIELFEVPQTALIQALPPSSKVSFNTATCHLRMGATQDAVSISHLKQMKWFSKALEQDTYLSLGYFARGNLWYSKGKYREAVSDYKKAAKYQQLGFDYTLHQFVLMYNHAVCLVSDGDKASGFLLLQDAFKASKHVSHTDCATVKHAFESIPSTEMNIIEIPGHLLYKPSERKVSNLARKDYLGKATVVASVEAPELQTPSPQRPMVAVVPMSAISERMDSIKSANDQGPRVHVQSATPPGTLGRNTRKPAIPMTRVSKKLPEIPRDELMEGKKARDDDFDAPFSFVDDYFTDLSPSRRSPSPVIPSRDASMSRRTRQPAKPQDESRGASPSKGRDSDTETDHGEDDNFFVPKSRRYQAASQDDLFFTEPPPQSALESATLDVFHDSQQKSPSFRSVRSDTSSKPHPGKIRVKCHANDVRIVQISADTRYSELVKIILRKFGRTGDTVALSYKDEDHVTVAITDDEDLELAIASSLEEGKLDVFCSFASSVAV